MSSNACMILVDTNVWLDNYLPNRKGHEDARRFLVRATATDSVFLLYSAPILKDAFYILASSLKEEIRREGKLTQEAARTIRQIAWSCIDNMRELGTAVGVDEADLWLACKYRQFNQDLEDNLVLAAAERAHANYLVTSDEHLIRKSTVTAFTPADMAMYLETKLNLR